MEEGLKRGGLMGRFGLAYEGIWERFGVVEGWTATLY